MSIYLSAPAIARLSACSRIAAHVAMRHGRYGQLVQRGRVPYADLAEVERNTGRQFTPEQIAMAVDGRPDRLITIDVEDRNGKESRHHPMSEARQELVETLAGDDKYRRLPTTSRKRPSKFSLATTEASVTR